MIKPSEINYLPESSGCYLFKNNKQEVLYVGKAKNLKKRVSSYFNKKVEGKTAALVPLIENIDFVITTNEVEAFLLENNLIKKYSPKYNIDLKDSKRYAYILLHEDKLPWIEVARLRDEKGTYYGPFVSGSIRKLIMEVISRNFKILTQKPSLILRKTINQELYQERVLQAKKILEGDVNSLIEDLNKKMKEHSNKKNYEYAITLRNQINALQTLKEKQLVELTKTIDVNVLNYLIVDDYVYLIIFNVRKGVLEEKQSYSFSYYPNFLSDFLVQYYDSSALPQELIIPEKVDSALEDYLKTKAKRKVSIIIPKKGDKKDLLELVYKNIETTFFTGSERIKELQKVLGLKKIPKHIECFDISHLSGTNTVASMVSFKMGLADKKGYRKFKINSDCQNDDYLAIREVIQRRYFGSLTKTLLDPDLIVIDGGLGQLSSAKKILNKEGKSIPIISLAKKLEEIYTTESNNPIILSHKNKGLQLLMAIRDEAHRFAVNYQRLLRSKSTFN